MLELLLTFTPAPPVATWDLMARELGMSIAHATLIAGTPDGFSDIGPGQRSYYWVRPALSPRGGPNCTFVLHAENAREPKVLAAWTVVDIEPPAPGCG